MEDKEKEKIEPYYQRQAKQIVDTLFEGKTFNEKLTRDDLQAAEDYFAFYLQSVAHSARRIAELTHRYKNR